MVMKRVRELCEKYLPGSNHTLIYIHIGKCGGASLNAAISQSKRLADEFHYITHVHVEKPKFRAGARYMIVLRNPITRALSAFNWRYRLVVDEASQNYRFPGEIDVLRKYGTLNSLAEKLYVDGELSESVAGEFRLIHHLKEDISFYLSDLLEQVDAEQIFAVLAQENLDGDIEAHLGVINESRIHSNRPETDSEKLQLSDLARSNLKRFLQRDYDAIRRLDEMHPIGSERLELLLA